MTWVLVILSFLILICAPLVKPFERLELYDFTDSLVSNIQEAGQYPYISEDGGCVPKLIWVSKQQTYLIVCGRDVIREVDVPKGIKVYLPTYNTLTFSQTTASYAGQWKFESGKVSVTLKFRIGTYEPEVIVRENG
ncbi:prepilin-type cleavage/methylation domain-containing protein [Exiguobacterium qingdaonense]|uniref:prepilin-type cleavage/methylation domain-containing protein n=1 Tax=Exiguobacterium qingdaonense TaxID=2751251 RepID=UPI001F0A7C5F|nr:prepilin-type cleavage/methylation domain-containing protein [Exiguobacterium qingdaonense]